MVVICYFVYVTHKKDHMHTHKYGKSNMTTIDGRIRKLPTSQLKNQHAKLPISNE